VVQKTTCLCCEESCKTAVFTATHHKVAVVMPSSQHPSTRASAKSIQPIYSGCALRALSDVARQFWFQPIFCGICSRKYSEACITYSLWETKAKWASPIHKLPILELNIRGFDQNTHIVLQPVPKIRLEMVIGMQNEVKIGIWKLFVTIVPGPFSLRILKRDPYAELPWKLNSWKTRNGHQYARLNPNLEQETAFV